VSLSVDAERTIKRRRDAGEADDSHAWVAALSAEGAERERATARLHELLLRAARFEVGRRRPELWARPGEVDELASQAASDAVMAILAKLGDYRGDSRFTTWAYKFALLEAAVKVRRRRWRDREVALDDANQAVLIERRLGTTADAESSELLGAIAGAIQGALTPHQRRVLIAVTLDGVPIDVLCERLGTTRGAVYKTLHDARRKLRDALALQGFEVTTDG
jgi:RNA polymerase sigma-70 factor, ECF subfamily